MSKNSHILLSVNVQCVDELRHFWGPLSWPDLPIDSISPQTATDSSVGISPTVGSTATQEEEVTVTNPGARTNPGVRTNTGAGTNPGVRTNPGARTDSGARTNLLSSVSLTPTQEKTK